MIAYSQAQSCHEPNFGNLANRFGMEGIEADAALIRALVEFSGHRPAAIARRAGVANTTINRHFIGTATTRLSIPTLEKLKEAYPSFDGFGSNAADLSITRDDNAYLPVEVMPTFGGMGGGGSGEGESATALLPRHLVEDQLRAKPADLLLIEVRGDSMMPDFLHGDQILVDRRDTNPRQPGPFALFDGDGIVIKLVERVPARRGYYRVFSANSRYSEYEVDEQDVKILGRPVWFARQI